ncbi:MAG: trigger factor [Lachnospiraceae bacterium]|nr:trigger factor [Lachnospiraceae bacterium]
MKKKLSLIAASVMLMTCLTGCNNYVKLCDYKGVEATNVVYDVTDEEVQEEIEYSMYDYVTYDPITNRGVEEGDYANITYTATVDGETNEDYSTEGEDVLVGEGWTYPELEEALVGMKTGDTKTVEFELTADYAEEEMVGKTISIEVVLNEITVENIPEYNVAFVKENFDYDTLEEYEAYMKESLLASKAEEYKYVAVEEIFSYIIENSTFNGYPDELYEQCEKIYNQNNEFYASMYGMSVEEFLEMSGVDEEMKKEEIEASVNYELVIQEIAKKEGIEVTEKEVTEYIESVYAEYGYESVDDFLVDYTTDEVKSELVYQKVSDFLYENASLVDMSEEDFLAEQESADTEGVEISGEEEGDVEIIEDTEDIEDTEE